MAAVPPTISLRVSGGIWSMAEIFALVRVAKPFSAMFSSGCALTPRAMPMRAWRNANSSAMAINTPVVRVTRVASTPCET